MNAQKLRGIEEKISHPIASIFILATLLLSAPLVHAEPITIEITGEVTSASGSALPDTIYDGVTFTGTYTYNSSTFDSDSDPNHGVYEYDSPYGISILLGGYEFKTTPGHIGQFEMRIINDDPTNGLHDYYIVCSQYENISVPSLGFNIGSISWNLWDSTYDALFSDALPLIAPALTDWDYNLLKIAGSGSGIGGISIDGTVTQAVLVPEPFTVTLMVIGIFFSRRRR